MTPLEKLQATYDESYSHVPFETYIAKVHEKHYSHVPFADFTDKLGLTAPPQELPQEPGPSPVAATASKIARPFLEYGGATAGGVVGAAGGPVGSLAGAGLGYGMGKGMADLFDEYIGAKKVPTVSERFKQSGKDVLTGATMEAGGLALGKGISAGGEALAKSGAAQRFYSSSIKMPLSQKWVKARGPEGVSNVKTAVNKGIKENVPPSEYGLEVAKQGKANAADAIDREISNMTGTYSTDDILKNGLQKAIDKAVKGEAPVKDIEAIKTFAENLKAGRAGDLSPTELNELKKELYKRANYDKMYGKSDSLIETMRKGVAHEIRMQLQATNPALKEVNADYAAWRLLEEAIERSLARRNNRDIVGLGTKVLLGRESIPMALFNASVGHPQVKSKIAFMLKGANKVTGATISRPAAYLAVPPIVGQ